MDVVRGQISHAHTPPNEKYTLWYHLKNRSILIISRTFWNSYRSFSQKGRSTVDWARWCHKALLRWAPRLSLALGPASARAGPGYHCMFLIYNISKFTQIWKRLFQLTQICFGLLKFTQMLIIYAILNEPLLRLSNSAQVGIKQFQLPKFYWGCWNYLNVSRAGQ